MFSHLHYFQSIQDEDEGEDDDDEDELFGDMGDEF